MQTLTDHARSPGGRTATLTEERERFSRPTRARAPETRFRACSGSPVVPPPIADARPGRLHAADTGPALLPDPSADALLPL